MAEPGMEPPEGMVSDFDNPDREMFYLCIVSNAIALVVCTIFMGLRLWARYRLSMRLQADDIACILGYAGFVVYSAICLLMLKYGGGLHQWDVHEHKVPEYTKLVYATMVNYGPTVFGIKAAILLFLIRIFSPYKIYVRWIYGFMGLMAVYYVAMLFLKIFICRPIPMFWGEGTDGECFNQRVLILTDNVISLLSDVVVLLLPCPLTKDLKVGTWAKVKIMAIFGVGGIACIFSLIRLVFIIQEGESLDQTYVFVKINLTGIAECGIGLVCACFPLMPALWKSILHKEKPGYSSNTKSQFEMNSRNAARSRSKTMFEDNDSDENDLIARSNAHFTTTVRAGDEYEEGSSRSHERHESSPDETGIVRTVEVRQFHENTTYSPRG